MKPKRPLKSKAIQPAKPGFDGLLRDLRDAAPDAFDAIGAEFPRLLSIDAAKFRAPRSLDGTWHFETNLSAEAIARYCQQIIAAAGYAANEWSVETR